jgi:hypothetical protein
MRDVIEESQKTPEPAKRVYYGEFPFLDWVKPEQGDVAFICVERIDLELLELVPCVGSEVCRQEICVYFVGYDGSKLMELKQSVNKRIVKFSIFQPSTWMKEFVLGTSVKQALVNLGDRLRELEYIVVVNRPRYWTKIQIFKLPKKFSLQEWVQDEVQKLQRQIAAEKNI